jgi:NADP-dependent 3-hydroxy acid dehydrogenase YdfG
MATDATSAAHAHTEKPSLHGRKAIITGGTSGIGRAIAVLLASEGVEVFTCGRDEQHLKDALERINEVGKGSGIPCDLSDQDQLDRFFAEAESKLGTYDIAIINAAGPAGALSETSEEDTRHAIALNFTSYVMSAHKAATHMKAGGRGDIVFIGSVSAHTLGGSSTIYAGIKLGIAGFAEALRKEVSNDDVKVGLVEPGRTSADMQLPDIPPDKQREMIAADQMLRAEDIAVAVQFMLTQPRRAVVQQLTITQRVQDE